MRRIGRRRGFTLIELVVVLAIVGIVAAVGVPALVAATAAAAPLDAGTDSVMALLRGARARSAAEGRTVTLTLDAPTRRYWMARAGVPESAGVLALPHGAALDADAVRAVYRFSAAGPAEGDALTVRTPAGHAVVTVDRWTGNVRRASAPRD